MILHSIVDLPIGKILPASKSQFRFIELFVVVHGQTLFLYAPCCACRSSAPLRGALLSCVDKKVTKEATRGGTEVDPIENLWFRSPSPRIKTVLPGTSPGNTSLQLCFLSSNIRSNSDLSMRFCRGDAVSSPEALAVCTRPISSDKPMEWWGLRLLLEEKVPAGRMWCAVKTSKI